MIEDQRCSMPFAHDGHRWWKGVETPENGGFRCPGLKLRPDHGWLKGECVAWLHDLIPFSGAVYTMVNDAGHRNSYSIDGTEGSLADRIVVVREWSDGTVPEPGS